MFFNVICVFGLKLIPKTNKIVRQIPTLRFDLVVSLKASFEQQANRTANCNFTM
jgi:hypothetical protein